MAAQVMSIGSGGSFLDSPGFSHKRTKIPPSGFNRREIGPPIRFDGGDFGEDLATPSYSSTSQVNTPDSGFSGTASCSLLKTPESDICSSAAATPSSSGSAATHRKRKTVNFDESQTCVVVISPDDLFNTYSKNQSE
ncbi:alpha-protein kinase 1-like isoform X2, partial [Biomphalaria pfeifferi]